MMSSRAMLCLLAFAASTHAMPQRSAICDGGDGARAHPSLPCSSDYFDCFNGEATVRTCAAGLVFDASVGSCADRPLSCDFTCTIDGDFPTSDCSNDYVTCTNGRAINQHCQADLVFDAQSNACNRREEIVACGGQPTQASPTQPPVACEGPDGLRAHPSVACSPDYFVCVGGVSIPKQCPIGLIFDQANLRCAREAEGCDFDCATRDDGMYGVGCSKHFWWCWNKMATRHECSAGLFFDADNNECTYEDTIVACGGTRRIVTTPANAPVVIQTVVFNCVENGDHQHVAGECSGSFVSCSNGNAYMRECPGGLVFDPDTRFCDRREQVAVCGGQEETPVAAPTAAPSNVCNGRRHGFKMPLGACSQSYTRCVSGVPTTVFCPEGQVYSDELGCDPPSWVRGCVEYAERIREETADRLEHVIIQQPIVDASTSACASMADGDHALRAGVCRPTYISCSNGVTHMRDCPEGLVFNEAAGFCDRSCDEPVFIRTEVQSPTSRPVPIDMSNECASMPDGDHSLHVGVCGSSYITCSNGITHMRDCPNGLVFNEAAGFCDRLCDELPMIPVNPPTDRLEHVIITDIRTDVDVSNECSSMPDGDHAVREGECGNSYITCSNGVTHMRNCPEGLVFNAAAGFCDRSCDVAPIGAPTDRLEHVVITDIRTDVDVSTECQSLPDGDHAVRDGECANGYITCSNGVTHMRNCPEGLVYNAANGICDRTCDSAEAQPMGPCANMMDGSRLEIDSCQTMYWSCQSGLPVVRACLVGEVFSSRVGCAVRSLVAECAPTSTGQPRVEVGFCATQPDGEYARDECSPRFYSCWLGRTTERTCQDGKIFDAQFGTCSARSFVASCSPATTVRPTTQRPTERTTRVFTSPPIATTDHVFFSSTQREYFINRYGQRVEQDNSGGYDVVQQPTVGYRQQNPTTAGYGPPLREPIDTGSYGQQAVSNYGAQPQASPCAQLQQAVANCLCVLAPGCQATCPQQGQAAPVPPQYGCQQHSEIAPCTEEFAFCQDGQTFPSWCEPGHVFNEFYQGCIHESEAPGCAAPPAAPAVCVEGNAREIGLCLDTFEACEFGDFVQKQCPFGTLFDTYHCIQPCAEGRCCPIGEVVESEPEPELPLPQLREPDCHEQTTAPGGPCHEQFYECVSGAWTLQWCPPGLVYGMDAQQCIPPQHVPTCEVAAEPEAEPEIEVDCIDNSRVAKGICVEEYFLCVNNEWTSAWCGEGGAFDADSASCVAVNSLAVCAPPVVEQAPQAPICIDTSTAPAGPCHEQFYLCVSNAWTLADCPSDQFYCPASQHCRSRSEIVSCPQDPVYVPERPVFSPVCPSYGQSSPFCLCAQ